MKKKIVCFLCFIMLFSSTIALASLSDYFDSWSETDSEFIELPLGGGYWLYSKRSVATSVGYTGDHYLRVYVGGIYKSSTDTGRVYNSSGFTLRSGWAYSEGIAVPATAYAFYGTA